MDTKIDIKDYDALLQQVAMGIDGLTDQMDCACENRASVLAGWAIVGKLAGFVYSAIAMAEIYRDRKLWKKDEERKQIDEWNFGMIMHYINNHALDRAVQYAQGKLSLASPDDHVVADMAEHETVLMNKVQEVTDDAFFAKLKDSVIELAGVLKEIFVAQHPEHQDGESVTGRVPEKKEYYECLPLGGELILQQAGAVRDFRSIFAWVKNTRGAWPMVAAYLLQMACDVEACLHTLASDDIKISRKALEEAAEYLEDPEGSIHIINMFEDEYLFVAETEKDEDLEKRIGMTVFPLIAHAEVAIRVTAPFQFVFPRVARTYKSMCVELKKKVTERLNNQ